MGLAEFLFVTHSTWSTSNSLKDELDPEEAQSGLCAPNRSAAEGSLVPAWMCRHIQILHKAHYLLLRALESSGWHHSFGGSLHGLVQIGFLQGRWVRAGWALGEALLRLCLGSGQRNKGKPKVPIGGAPRRTRQGCRAGEGPIQKWQW